MVVQKLRIVFEDRALLRFLNVHLHRQQPLFAHLVQKLVHHLQRVQIALPCRNANPSSRPPTRPATPLMMCIGLATSSVPAAAPAMISSSAGCSSTSHVPFLHQKAANHRCKYQHNAYDGEHSCLPGADVTRVPARMDAGLHGLLRALQQLRQSVIRVLAGLRRANAHGELKCDRPTSENPPSSPGRRVPAHAPPASPASARAR